MERMKGVGVLAVLAALWGCGGDSSSGPDVAADRVPPARPANLRVDKIRDGEVWLSWNAVVEEGEEIRYVVYRSEDRGSASAVETSFRTSFQDFGLEYETEYTYFVIAVDAAGNESQPSNSVSGQPFNNLAPLAPTGLRAFAHNLFILSQRDISLDWDRNVETDLVAYRVYRSTVPNFAVSEELVRAEVVVPRFVDEDVEVGTFYHYKVTAIDRGGKESPASDEVSDVPLALPEQVVPVQGELTSSQPVFRWRIVPGALAYQVIVTTSPTSGEISAIPLTRDTTAVFVGRSLGDGKVEALKSGQIYYWKVIASTRENGQENSVSKVESFKVR